MALTPSPGDPPRDHKLTWLLLPPLVMAGGVAAAAALAGSSARWPVVWFGVVAVAIAVVLAAQIGRRGRLIADLYRQQADREVQLRQQLAEQEAATARLADVLLPGAIFRLHQGDAVEEVLADVDRGPGFDPAFKTAHESMLRSVVEAVKTAEDLRESAQRAFVNIARRVQAIVHQQFRDLREMEERHGGEPEVFGDLLRLDHGTALIGRLADSITVLGGSRPGRQWQQDIPLFSILRGAMSRITDYQRVDLHSVMEVAVVGPVVEPLIHALAELLDNATRYSPPQTRVHLTSVEIQSGIAIEIEDGGVGLSEVARVRAERVLSNVSAGIDLADLGETPRLGLSVVGRLAQANRFQVSLRQSAYSGVRAVLVVPRDLITALPEPAPAAPATERVSRRASARPISIPDQRSPTTHRPVDASVDTQAYRPTEFPQDVPVNGDSLPQRRRRGIVATPSANGGHSGAEGPGGAGRHGGTGGFAAAPPAASATAPHTLPPLVTLPNGSSAPAPAPTSAPTRNPAPTATPSPTTAPTATSSATPAPAPTAPSPSEPWSPPSPPSSGSAASAGTPAPGLWLAAFQNAVSGGNPAPGPSRSAGDESSTNEGE